MSTVKVDTLATLDGSMSAEVAEIITRMGAVGGTVASHDAQVTPDDTTLNRVLLNGAHGLGVIDTLPLVTQLQLDDYSFGANGQTYRVTNPTGLPAGTYLLRLNRTNSTTVVHQELLATNISNSCYSRIMSQSLGVTSWDLLWTSSSLVKQSSQSDPTAGAVMLNGAWGIGTSSSAPLITDCDTTLTGGIFRFAANCANAPLTTLGHLLVLPYNGATSQIVIDRATQQTFVRTMTVSVPPTWSTWKLLAFNPMTASGDITYGGTNGTPTKLAKGTDTQVLTLFNGLPAWKDGGASESTQTVNIDSGYLDLSAVTVGTVLVSLTENIISINMPPATAGKRKELVVQFTQDGIGGRTVIGWPGTVSWSGGAAPFVSSKALSVTHISLSNADNTVWIGYNQTNGGMNTARIPATQRTIAGAVNATALGTIAATASRIQYIPFIPSRRMKITQLGLNVTTLVAGTATMGIYASDGHASYDYPGTRLAVTAQGDLSTTTVGTKVSACDYVLEPGVLYFIAVICTAACTLRGVPLAAQSSILGWTDNSTTCITSYYSAGSTNVLPVTAGTPIVNAGIVNPALYLIEG